MKDRSNDDTSHHERTLLPRSYISLPPHRQDSTYHGLCYTSREPLAGTRNSSMGPPHEGSVQWPIAPWANALTTELHLTPSPQTRQHIPRILLHHKGSIRQHIAPWANACTTELHLAPKGADNYLHAHIHWRFRHAYRITSTHLLVHLCRGAGWRRYPCPCPRAGTATAARWACTPLSGRWAPAPCTRPGAGWCSGAVKSLKFAPRLKTRRSKRNPVSASSRQPPWNSSTLLRKEKTTLLNISLTPWCKLLKILFNDVVETFLLNCIYYYQHISPDLNLTIHLINFY